MIRALIIQGDLTEAEWARFTELAREIDTVPGRLIHVEAVGSATIEEARAMVLRAIPEREGRETSEITRIAIDERLLSSSELLFVSNNLCPDCAERDLPEYLAAGPRGGMNQNFACPHCGSEFNVAKHGGTTVWGQRLSLPGKPNLERLRSTYGIEL